MTGINKTPQVVSSSPKTFIQLCEDLAAKRKAGALSIEQEASLQEFRKSLASSYNSAGKSSGDSFTPTVVQE